MDRTSKNSTALGILRSEIGALWASLVPKARRRVVDPVSATHNRVASHRKTSLEPSDKLIDQVLASCPAKSRIELATKLVSRMNYDMASYDRACSRAERFVKNRGTTRMPTHIKDKFVLKRVVEKSLTKRFPLAEEEEGEAAA